ncbi:MAG: hypothetical protein QM713_07555 [Arachnia sp.]
MRPMLAVPTATHGVPPSGDEWIHEIKWDGVRALAETVDGRLRLFNRTEGDITLAYPEVVESAEGLPDGLLLDGELVAIDPDLRVPALHAVVARVHVRGAAEARQLAGERPVTFVAFDLLRIDGRDITRLPLSDRRLLLEQLDLDRPSWHLSDTFDDAAAAVDLTRSAGLEGVMSKRRSSPYRPGSRSADWVKTPHRDEVVAVIGGWLPEVGDDRRLGALWIGHAADEATFDVDPVLYPLGRVGSGLSHADRDALLTVLEGTTRDTAPFDPPPTGPDARRSRWVEPLLCVQVRYLTVTPGGSLRQPVITRLRPDVDPVAAASADTH